MDAAWPPVTYEALPWHREELEYISRRQKRQAAGPYQASVPSQIASRAIPLDGDLVALTEEAASELARFDAEVGHVTAPFAAILLRTESASSSQIENLTSGAKQIALAELGANSSVNAGLIVGNVHAMQAALDLAAHLDAQSILEMHRALLERDNPQIVGHWRKQQVWIGGSSFGPHTAVFVPPHQDRVAELMNDLVVFANRVDLPVLAQTAIAHAQFETIHPFPDGNGRVGRALIHSMLRGGQLTRHVTIPVSAGLLHNTSGYFDALTAYRTGDIAPIVRSIAEASFIAVHSGRALVTDLELIRTEWGEKTRARRDSAVHRLADLLLQQPVIDAGNAAVALSVSTVNAQVAINRLVDAGILTQITAGRRNRLWVANDVVHVLDEFAARATRR